MEHVIQSKRFQSILSTIEQAQEIERFIGPPEEDGFLLGASGEDSTEGERGQPIFHIPCMILLWKNCRR